MKSSSAHQPRLHLSPPGDGSPYFSRMLTRETALPPCNMKLSVLQVGHYCVPKGEFIPAHTTYYSWIGWVVRGQFSLRSYGSERNVSAGFAIVGAPGESISAHALEDQSEAYALLMDGADCARLLKESGLWPAVFPYRTNPVQWLEIIAERIANATEQSRAASCGHSLFVTLRHEAEQLTPDPLIFRVCQYIQEHWKDLSLNVDQVLEHFALARSTLAPRFKRVTGMSLLHYMMDIRGHHAEQLLCTTQATIQQVSHETGFSDPAYFTAWFRKRTGQTPGQFRSQNNPVRQGSL